MKTAALVSTALLLVTVGPAWCQTGSGPELRGRIEQLTDNELVVRGEDGRLHFVDTAAISSAELGLLKPGDDVTITTKGEGARGPIGCSVSARPRHASTLTRCSASHSPEISTALEGRPDHGRSHG